MDMAFPSPPQPLVGREQELTVLRARLAEAIAGRGSLGLIGGEAGVGKSALADALCREAALAGANVFVGQCYDRSETPPYGPWLEGLDRLSLRTPSLLTPPSLAAATGYETYIAQMRDFFYALAAECPLVLVLEDLHWADSASLDLLRFLARGLGDMPLLLIATYRDEGMPLETLIPLLVREAPTERIALRPLDDNAVRALVRGRYDLPGAEARRLAAYLLNRTEGNPLVIVELLRTLEEHRAVHWDSGGWRITGLTAVPVPLLLKQIIDARLTRLGDDAAALLAIAAVIGHEVPLAVWQSVAAVDGETLLRVAERVEMAHLITASKKGEGIRFAHALIRDVLYESVPTLRRKRLHRQVAEVLAASPSPDPDAVAYHFQRTGDARAPKWLIAAAERAERAFSRRAAAERYQEAAVLLGAQSTDADESGWLRLRAAVLLRYEDADAAQAQAALAEEAATAGAPRLAAYARIVQGYALAAHGAFAAALNAARAGRAALAAFSPPDAAQRAREAPFATYLEDGPLVIWSAFMGAFAEAQARGERLLGDSLAPPATREGAARDAPIWATLAYIYAMQGEPARARWADDIARAAYILADRYLLSVPLILGAFAREILAYVADVPPERDWIVDNAERTTRRAMGIAQPDEGVDYARSLRLPVLVIEGRWREARELADQLAVIYKSYPVVYPRRLALGLIAHAQGETDQAWGLVYEAFPAGAATEPGGMHLSFGMAMQRLAIDLAIDSEDLSAARGWLEAHDRWLTWSGAVLGQASGQVRWARYYRLAGEHARAVTAVRAALEHASTPRQPLVLLAVHRTLGELATDTGDPIAAGEHLAASLALADACRAPYERALTLLAQAELAMEVNEHNRALMLFDEVRAICIPMDAHLALARADRIATNIARPVSPKASAPRFPAGLSAREVDVLRLVAAGLGNAEIAEQLFLSPRTVKAHITNIYAKIGVRHRAAATQFALHHHLA